jgi:hypothetical protein
MGWGARTVSRGDTIKELKKLGDLCLCSGQFKEAFSYYQQLYQELSEEDIAVHNSLSLMIAVTSILTTDEVDIFALLKPIIQDKRVMPHLYVMTSFIVLYYTSMHSPPAWTIKIYNILCSYLVKSAVFDFGKVVAPLLREASSTVVGARHAALFFWRAAAEYRELGLPKNALIALWCGYNLIWTCCWPRVAHFLLLQIANLGPPPENLLDVLTHKSMGFVPETVAQLRRIAIPNLIFLESVSIRGLSVSQTGFPFSPRPRKMSFSAWSKVRKRLFPVVYHPSTEAFANHMWSTETDVSHYQSAVNEPCHLSFRLSTTLTPGTQLSDVQLFCEPEGFVKTDILPRLELTSCRDICFSFSPTEAGKFIISGIRAVWFDVAPVAIAFPQRLSFESIDDAPLLAISLVSKPEFAYAGIPFRFRASLKHVIGKVSWVNALAETSQSVLSTVTLEEPALTGVQGKYTLDLNNLNCELEFKVLTTFVGELLVRVFVSYSTASHKTRYAFESFAVDCRALPKVQFQPGNDCVRLSPRDEDYTVECDCAVVELERGIVKLREVRPEFAEKKFVLQVQRSVLGTVVRDVFQLSGIWMSFGEGIVTVETFPAEVEFRFSVLCLGNTDGRLLLKEPGNMQWFWIGKSQFVVAGPRRVEICATIYALGPFKGDLGELIAVASGGYTPTFHHDFEVRAL